MNKKIGNIIADQIYSEINQRIRPNSHPSLCVVQVGDDPASTVYIKYKRLACKKLGFGFIHEKCNTSITTEELYKKITNINNNNEITGCIVQLPLPDHIDKNKILDCVDVDKDVDCFNTLNIGKLYLGIDRARFVPATAFGVVRFIKYYKVDTVGKCIVIIGKSKIVGKPLQLLLSEENNFNGGGGTTIFCDKYTENINLFISLADILIVAAGKHHLINDKELIKDGCVVVDVGIHRIKKGNKFVIEGDVNYDLIKDKCKLITSVPGGVGPMTVASLMWNVAKPFFK